MILILGHVHLKLGISFECCGWIVITRLLYLISIQLTASTDDTLVHNHRIIHVVCSNMENCNGRCSNHEMIISTSKTGGQLR